MVPDSMKGKISVWQAAELEGLELRRGIGISEPYPRHWHDEYQFCLVQTGGGELHYRGTRHDTPASSLFIVHPGEVHANLTGHRAGCSFRSIYAAPGLLRRAAADVLARTNAGLPSDPFFPDPIIFDSRIIALYLKLHQALESPRSLLEQESLFLELTARLVERYARQPIPDTPEHHSAVSRVREYIAEHYASNIPLTELSAIADLSPWHLTRIFAREVGMPPHTFQIQLRILHAKKLLRQGWPVSQASAQTGFADQSHFTRHFKRLMLITPGQYINNSKIVQDAFQPSA